MSHAAPASRLSPPIDLLLAESRSLLALHLSPVPRRAPAAARDDIGPVLVLPGFLSNDRSTRLLRNEITAAGFVVHGWNMGRNLGVRADTIERIDQRVDAIRARDPRPVTLVGWSLGGLMAREYAKHAADKVRRVVTLGSPFSGDPRANRVWRLYEMIAGHPVDAPPIDCRLSEKPPVDTVALWSRRDGVVGHRPARGLAGEADRTVELDCTHIGFCVDRRAIDQVVRAISS